MKTQKIQNLLVVTLLCAAVLAGLTACDADPVEREGGKLPDKDGLENTYGMLRSNRASENEAYLLLTQGAGFVTDNIYYQITKPAAEGLALEIWVDNSLLEGFNQANETEYELLPDRSQGGFANRPETNQGVGRGFGAGRIPAAGIRRR